MQMLLGTGRSSGMVERGPVAELGVLDLGFWLHRYTLRPSTLNPQRLAHFRPWEGVLPVCCHGDMYLLTSVKVKCFKHSWLRCSLFPLLLPFELGGIRMAIVILRSGYRKYEMIDLLSA